ncbi:MAG: hypothetical protein AAFP90_21610, partial [Planctomycetota bacterium]
VDVNLFQSTTVAQLIDATTNAPGTTLVDALAEQGLVGIAITGAGAGFAAVAGAIGVSSVNNTTIARISGTSDVNQDGSFSSNEQDVVVRSESRIGGTGKKLLGANDNNIIDSFTTGRGSGSGGLAGVATSIDIVTLRPRTLAEIGDGAMVSAARDVDIHAHTDLKVNANTFSFAIGAVAVNATVGVVTIGSGLDAEDSEAAIGESDDNGDTRQSVTEKQLRLFDKVLGIESRAAAAAGDAFDADARSEGSKVLIGDEVVLNVGGDLNIESTTNLDLETLVGQGQGGLASFGGSVNYITTGLSANVEIDSASLVSGINDSAGTMTMRAHNAADLTGEAVAGAGGTVSIAAQAAVIKDSSSERIRLAEDAFLFGQQRLSMIAGRNQTINATAIGGQAGGFVAGAAIAQTDVTGSTIVDIGNNTTLNAANVVIGTDTNIVTDAVSRSVAVGGITAAASDARSSITPTIQTR